MPANKPRATSKARDHVCWALEQMLEMDHRYRLAMWNRDKINDCIQDMTVMFEEGELASCATEVLAKEGSVLLACRIHFDRLGGRPTLAFPLLESRDIASGRFLVDRRDRTRAYESRLVLEWSHEKPHPHRRGERFGPSGQPVEFHIARCCRRNLVVTKTGTRGFAFGHEPVSNQEVYLHTNEAAPGVSFVVGSQLSAILVAAPEGVQGCSIQRA